MRGLHGNRYRRQVEMVWRITFGKEERNKDIVLLSSSEAENKEEETLNNPSPYFRTLPSNLRRGATEEISEGFLHQKIRRDGEPFTL